MLNLKILNSSSPVSLSSLQRNIYLLSKNFTWGWRDGSVVGVSARADGRGSFSLFYIVYMSALFTCMSMHHERAWCLKKSEESTGSSGNRVVDGCEPPCWCWEMNSGHLEEQASALNHLMWVQVLNPSSLDGAVCTFIHSALS